MEILTSLEQECEDIVVSLSSLDVTTEDYTIGAKNYSVVHECLMKEKELELEKYKANINYNIEDRRVDNEARETHEKVESSRKDRRDNYVRSCLYVGGTLALVIVSFAGSQSGIMDTKLIKTADGLLRGILRVKG